MKPEPSNGTDFAARGVDPGDADVGIAVERGAGAKRHAEMIAQSLSQSLFGKRKPIAAGVGGKVDARRRFGHRPVGIGAETCVETADAPDRGASVGDMQSQVDPGRLQMAGCVGEQFQRADFGGAGARAMAILAKRTHGDMA